MSIYLRKSIGYGLTDVRTTDRLIDDPRINPSSRLLQEPTGHDWDDYLAYLETQTDFDLQLEPILLHKIPPHTKDPDEAVDWDEEYGLPNVLCVRPLYAHTWTRIDDPIDRAETFRPGAPTFQPSVTPLHRGIFPYNADWMDSRTGNRCPREIAHWIETSSETPKPFGTEILDKLAQRGGFADHQDALAHAAPAIPPEIQALVTWGQLFTDPSAILQLRPMIYTRQD